MKTVDLEAFRAWLETKISTTPVKAGPLPDTPDRLVAVQEYDGPEVPNWRADDRVQIRWRSALAASGTSPYADCFALKDQVIAAVAPPQDLPVIVTLYGGRRAILRKLNGPHSLGPDSKGRWEMSINVGLEYFRA